MTAVQAIMILIIRLWAAGYIISVLAYAPSTFEALFSETPPDAYFLQLAAGQLMWLAAGIAAWFGAPWLARHVQGENKNFEITAAVDGPTLVAIGSFLIGLFYIVEYAPLIIMEWLQWVVRRAGETPLEEGQLGTVKRNSMDIRMLIPNLLIVFVASVMALRPSYLARLFVWARTAGHPKEEAAPSAER